MRLTSKQLQENYKKLINIIKDTFEEGSKRRERLLKMYHDLEDRIIVAPASGKEHYHYSFAVSYKPSASLIERLSFTLHLTPKC